MGSVRPADIGHNWMRVAMGYYHGPLKQTARCVALKDDLVWWRHSGLPLARAITHQGNKYFLFANLVPVEETSNYSWRQVWSGAWHRYHNLINCDTTPWPNRVQHPDRFIKVDNVMEPDWHHEVQRRLAIADRIRERRRMPGSYADEKKLRDSIEMIEEAQRISECFGAHVPGLYGEAA